MKRYIFIGNPVKIAQAGSRHQNPAEIRQQEEEKEPPKTERKLRKVGKEQQVRFYESDENPYL